MKKNIQYQYLISVLFIFLSMSNQVLAADFFEKDNNEIIWQSGINQYIKYAELDTTKFANNQHPARLSKDDIKYALLALEIPDDSFFSLNEDLKPVFTRQQIKLLSETLPKGLSQAAPEQDIIFAIEKIVPKVFGLKEHAFVVGRLFYKENKLNIIFGEYDFFRSKAFESAYDPSGQGGVPYTFNLGMRSKASRIFVDKFIDIPGVENKMLGKKRRSDWLVIDVKLAADTYIADMKNQQKTGSFNDKQLEKEAAKLAKQRREMRAEMARMRKEIDNMQQNSSLSPMSAKSIAERMAVLDTLLNKKLITKKEYDKKRKEILDKI